MRRWVMVGCSLVAIAALVIGITQTSGTPKSDTPTVLSAAETAQQLQGSAPRLAAIHSQSSELLGGQQRAYGKRIKALSGLPIVVNVWASWCHPCRQEMPVLNNVSAQLGKRVAFLGVNANDASDDARTFLKRIPVSYPSYSDPDQKIAGSLGVAALPATLFLDRRGNATLHQGPYDSVADLERDIRRYALNG